MAIRSLAPIFWAGRLAPPGSVTAGGRGWAWDQAEQARTKAREINNRERIRLLAADLAHDADRLEGGDELDEDGIDTSEPLSEGIELVLDTAVAVAIDAGAG